MRSESLRHDVAWATAAHIEASLRRPGFYGYVVKTNTRLDWFGPSATMTLDVYREPAGAPVRSSVETTCCSRARRPNCAAAVLSISTAPSPACRMRRLNVWRRR